MSLNQRIQGIRDTLGERYPEIRIADLRTGKGDPELTLAVIEQQVARFPDFDSFTVSNGISVAAPTGTPIHAVFEGEVIFADAFKGYGNMVIVDHGGGFFSLYAHAASIAKKVGAKVAKNEVLGSVGELDSAKGPMLYFEIRYQGKPVDPAPWFR